MNGAEKNPGEILVVEVAQALTEAAPFSISTSAAFVRVPAVSIMSSTMMMLRPSTSPMAVMEETMLAFSLVLWQMMTGQASSLA